jgi:hypothetical protein
VTAGVDRPVRLDGPESLEHLPDDLQSLAVSAARRGRPSLRPLARFSQLRELSLEHLDRDIEVIAGLPALEVLKLRSITLEDLTLLRSLPRLRRLELRLGGTSDLRGIEGLRLEYLEIWRVRGLADLTRVAALPELDFLFLQALPHVTALPDLSGLTKLGSLTLDTMKGFTDFRGVAAAPALHGLAVFAMNHIRWEHLEPLAGHPTLRDLAIGTGSLRRNAELEARLRATLPSAV